LDAPLTFAFPLVFMHMEQTAEQGGSRSARSFVLIVLRSI